jgi:glycosyltransferase involved in cell wall biosynthesis
MGMRTGPPKAAVIISTYNWPSALRLVLQSALVQNEPAFELVIVDDGSKPETAELVAATLKPSDARWCHVRQEDTGFRQSRVRNLGVRHSTAPLLIFIDHDTLLHPDFVTDHIRLAGEGIFVQGKRCFLPPDFSEQLIRDGLRPDWWPSPWRRGLENRKNALYLPALGRLFAVPKPFESSIRGCNLAVRREDFLKVDGFDELYDGVWGREDSDFAYRLFHSGIRCRNAWFAALQAHLHHQPVKRRERDRLDDELERMRAERRTQAVRGFSRMDGEGVVLAASAGYRQT